LLILRDSSSSLRGSATTAKPDEFVLICQFTDRLIKVGFRDDRSGARVLNGPCKIVQTQSEIKADPHKAAIRQRDVNLDVLKTVAHEDCYAIPRLKPQARKAVREPTRTIVQLIVSKAARGAHHRDILRVESGGTLE
jgi:hypothetical protein